MFNNNYHYIYFLAAGLLLLNCIHSSAQENKDNSSQTQSKDSFLFSTRKQGWLRKLGKSISVTASAPSDSASAAKENVAAFIPYADKPIRKIIFTKIDYGQFINDTSVSIKNFLTRTADKLHVATRQTVMKNNLFFNEKTKLNPYLVADNETYLRTISYLQDAKIIVTKSVNDSVDVNILYKDVFPIGGSIISADGNNIYLEGKDENFLGYGDRIQDRLYFDLNRNPNFGLGAEYVKRNIAGSFINGTIGYENITPAFNNGKRQENNVYLKFDLPLVHPNRLFTGGFEASTHFTNNNYVDDSLYNSTYKYCYNYFDGWIGFNISRKKKSAENKSRTLKKFITLRVSTTDFRTVPDKYLHQYNFQYASINSLLASYTIFKQEFYHTSFIYGFGRNEDIPKGYNISFIGGITNKEDYVRPYCGMDVTGNVFDKHQNYYKFTYRFNAYYRDKKFEDISFLTCIDAFSRLRRINNSHWLIRHFATGGFTQQIRTKLNEPLVLNSSYGLEDFRNPDTLGSSRVTVRLQTVFYNTWGLAGFRFAPFTFGNISYIKNIGEGIFKGKTYSEWGIGVRSRNESLVFGTMELKISYYPTTVQNMTQWGISFNTNLNYKYSTQYVQRPDFVDVN